GAADLFEAARVPDDGRDLRAVRRDGLLLDLHQRADDVHPRMPGDVELLPALALAGSILPQDLQLDGSCLTRHGHSAGPALADGRCDFGPDVVVAPAVSYFLARGFTSETSTSSVARIDLPATE